MAEVRVTGAGIYVEVEPDAKDRVTATGTYVEIVETPRVDVTAAGVYVEIGPISPPPGRSAGNVSVRYNGSLLDDYLQSLSLKSEIGQIETTNMSSNGGERITGLAEWTLEVGGSWAPALDNILGIDAVSPSSLRNLRVLLARKVLYTWTGTTDLGAFVSDYQITAPGANEAIKWTATITCSGPPSRIVSRAG